MLVRARQAAAAPQKIHRPVALPLPAAARPSLPYTAAAASATAAHHMAPGTSNPAAARPAALMSVPVPAASLQIATALAAKPSQHTSPVHTNISAAPAATTAAHAYTAHQPVAAAVSQSMPTAGVASSNGMPTAGASASHGTTTSEASAANGTPTAGISASHGTTTSGAGLVSFVPQLSQLLRPQGMQQGVLGESSLPPLRQAQPAGQAQQAQQAQQATAGQSSLAGSGLHPNTTQLSSMPPSATAVAAPMRSGNTLASLLQGQPATAPVYSPAAVASDTAAVAGSSRGMRLIHKASLDVLRLKLRLVDLVQGCPVLQPKVSRCMPTRVPCRICSTFFRLTLPHQIHCCSLAQT